MSLAALGVVYGDVGTSPLYAVRECFAGPHRVAATPDNVLGVLSLVFWSLGLVISVKYLVFVMRADNRGEGGILSLMSLIRPHSGQGPGRKRHFALVVMGLFGAALLYGDGMITPAISVLSAIEGLQVATPVFTPYVIPITVAILIALFLLQRRGTARVGAMFGPVMIVWFTTIAALGVWHIARAPQILAAVNPLHGVVFFVRNGWHGFLVLGSVFLVVTGGEALYADMGHFGRKPIRLAWFAFVFPSLLLNYFGQGALILHSPAEAHSPFYNMVPQWGLYPMVVLATAATVIASQAVISGAFSLTRQASLLGYAPRVRVQHTSAREIGQIYIPAINWTIMIAAIGLVIGFGESSRLAAAYGVAVTTTMAITTILFWAVARHVWGWKLLPLSLLTAAFLVVDLAFFGANIIKVPDGGWFPLVVALIVYTIMTTWRRGRQILNDRLKTEILPIDLFLSSVKANPPLRVPGNAVFMFRSPDGTPPALLHNIKHNKVLHEKVVFLTVVTEEISHVLPDERLEVRNLGSGIYQIIVHYGFMETPHIPELLQTIKQEGLDFRPETTSYFLGRETLIATAHPGMAIWREKLFSWMSRNATSAASFFQLPPNRVVELGAQIEL